jgi:hypothetical protein
MAGKMLSVEPTIDPSAKLHDTRLGADCEVGARTILHEVALGDYSYVVNDAQITYTTIKRRFSQDIANRLAELEWWDWDHETLRRPARFPKTGCRGVSRKIRGRDPFRRSTHQTKKRGIVTDILIEGGRALLGNSILETSVQIASGRINAVGSDHGSSSFGLDARDLLVLPGIVDLHGDAFERQMMPRPGVDFPVDVALIDSDR